MKGKPKLKFILPAALCVMVLLVVVCFYLFASFSNNNETAYLYIDQDDNIDSVANKITPMATDHGMATFKILARHTSYDDNIKTGRYAIEPGDGAFTVFRHLKNGMQTPVRLTVPSVRTTRRLAAELAKHLMLDSTEIASALADNEVCKRYGYDTTTIACLFIPNTYDLYWNISLEKLLQRMEKENKAFWNTERTTKAKALKLSPTEVMTLASIVDEETANNGEKPMVAGMYYNRLMLRDAEYPDGMPLQADPTIKFALQDFALRRIYHKHLTVDSPYNTYMHPGLPPGPIRIPSVAGIDAVLNLKHHDYLYMCANEDFSGTHKFARTYKEHLANAARYAAALNERGIQ